LKVNYSSSKHKVNHFLTATGADFKEIFTMALGRKVMCGSNMPKSRYQNWQFAVEINGFDVAFFTAASPKAKRQVG
jgi:hypothetical protein